MATNEIEIYQPDAEVAGLKLWRPPSQVLIEAQQAAKELQMRIAGKNKPVIFNGKQYLENEDWQMLAHFYGYCPKIESTEQVEFGEARGFKASAVLVNEHTGLVVSRAEAMCLNDEDNWGDRAKYEWKNGERHLVGTVKTPTFQLLSMAETRATSKVMRLKLAWIVVLAGYEPTPAEEMDQRQQTDAAPVLPAELKKKSPPAAPAAAALPSSPTPRPEQQSRSNGKVVSEAQARRFYAIRKGSGWTSEQAKDYLRSAFGIEDDRLIPANRYEEACRWAQTRPQ